MSSHHRQAQTWGAPSPSSSARNGSVAGYPGARNGGGGGGGFSDDPTARAGQGAGRGWGVPPGQPTKELLVGYIERACDPSLHEPNLSLDLEIADLINQKKANTPREAAVEVVRLINHRNTHVAMLALHLLDILVKNCGYPFHLQISTKEFLNELVRRFPERPPTFPPPPMKKVLELVHEWKNTICVTSKHKEDLVHVRDMHRLLSYKGYRFPDFDRRAASVLNPTENLQTPDELEEEDREAQAAKLQELIRRGTPKDLAAAQELMVIMSGAAPEKTPDYEAQVAKELDRIQQRVLLLNEMLNNAKPKERFVDGDAYDQIAQKCRHVQPKLQKWIADSAENNPDAMDRLLLINDLINQVIKRYESFKAGDRAATAEIDPALNSTSAAGSKAKQQAAQVSLIDFDDDGAFDAPAGAEAGGVSLGATTPQPGGGGNPLDDLASLSLGGGATSGGAAGGGGGGLFDLNAAFGNSSSSSATPSSTLPPPIPTISLGGYSTAPPPLLPTPSSSSSSSSYPVLSAQNTSTSNSGGGGGGSFFTNPAYGVASSSQASRSGTPLSAGFGSIQLGGGGGGQSMASMQYQQQQQQLGGRSPPLPPVPPKQQKEAKKDAFADLLGDF